MNVVEEERVESRTSRRAMMEEKKSGEVGILLKMVERRMRCQVSVSPPRHAISDLTGLVRVPDLVADPHGQLRYQVQCECS